MSMHPVTHDVVKLLLQKIVLKVQERDGTLKGLANRPDMCVKGGEKSKAVYANISLVLHGDSEYGKYRWDIHIEGPKESAHIFFNEDGEHLVTWDSKFHPQFLNKKIPGYLIVYVINF